MRYSGLIYAVIVAAWAGVLVPRWVRRNEEVDQAIEADAARGVRVLERSEPRRHIARGPLPHMERTILSGGYQGLGVGAGTAVLDDEPGADISSDVAADPEAEIRLGGAHAAQRRRRVLLMFLGALVLAVAGAVSGVVGVWVPVTVGALSVVFLAMCRRAAVRERVHAARMQRFADPVEEAPMEEDVEVEPEVRVAVLDIPESAEDDPDAWAPVPVPRPTYLEKPAIPREAARSIDLSSSGAWTSGRLDPDETISVPAAASSQADDGDDLRERRRAVGD